MTQYGITAISYYLPETVETNHSLAGEFPGKVDEKLIENIGIKSRHIAERDLRASDMGVIVGNQLFAETGFPKEDIGALVYTSLNHDYITPATSCLIQHELGLKTGIASFDLNHGCSGYLYGLALSKSIMSTLHIDNVLLISSTIPTRYVHPKNLSIRLLFGDASAATLIRRHEGGTADIGEFVLGTDGKGYQKIIIRDGWDRNPLSDTSLLERTDEFGNIYTDSSIDMDGPGTFFFILKNVPRIIQETVVKNGLRLEEVDLFVLHQANQYALEQVRMKLKIPEGKFYYFMENTGNTIQSTIPIALKEAMRDGLVHEGTKVLVAGFGTGNSWGATVLTF
ncbi:MAG: ketoacyl-ACP synthase III [Bacteroidetes bacterium]|nr:ketoacyl-ACP synthase III [Bacteroidota bacterium]